MKAKQPLWTRDQVEDLVHVLAQTSARVIFTGHCLERLAERGVTTGEALRCLQRGRITSGPDYDAGRKTYKFLMSEAPPRDVVCIVAAIEPDPEPGKLFAITVWDI
ncbi:DUF4258 domain-containing protein [uncultured Stutzerimonas sp.]|uniref:DUF4258 domain-containing protein n=1 Tax=uncultured Stutzerimonas sp. TaxID=2901168 RepID=UPI0032B28E44|tara:strand:+ start:383 stop:700 length:318 start_codon:yes stop_codon:yes gene_type:complete